MKKSYIIHGFEELSQGQQFIEQSLREYKVSQKLILRNLLISEEYIKTLINASTDSSPIIKVEITRLFGDVCIRLYSKGAQIDGDSVQREFAYDFSDEENPDIESAVQTVIQKIMVSNTSCSYKHGTNTVDIKVASSKYRSIILTFIGLFAGIIAGALVRNIFNADISNWLDQNVFKMISDMFMNAIKLIVAPLVFFSIADSIADIKNLNSMGRIALKVLSIYVVTSLIAISVGYLTYQIFPIGDASIASAVSDSAKAIAQTGGNMKVSIRDTIFNIVPSDIIHPFLQRDMLQIIFFAILTGVGVTKISDKFTDVRKGVSALNALFTKMTFIVIDLMPVAIFCSMTSMVLGLDISNFGSIIVWIPVCIAGLAVMFVFYLLLLMIFGRVNPLSFVRNYSSSLMTALSTGSSNATLPTSINALKQMGVDKSVYSFALPLGTTINMDGSCIVLMISGLFMAKTFGVAITSTILFTMFISIMVLSLGAPGVPGAALVCMAVLFPQIGVPVEAVSIVMGLYPIVGRFLVCVNCAGDAAVTYIVAKSEKKVHIV